MLEIKNRRYIGNKNKILFEIEKVVKGYYPELNDLKFADVFAGTGVVGYHFANLGCKTIVNDILYSNFVCYNAWFGKQDYDVKKISDFISWANSIKGCDLEDNYFSISYGGKYFSVNNAKKIGYIRDQLEIYKPELNEREFFIILSSLIYAVDKIANTVGHFESYLNKIPEDKNLILQMLDITEKLDCQIFCENANDLVEKINADVVYLDPPYNARQYASFYHVLENLSKWNKPELFGKTMKFKNGRITSKYSTHEAKTIFEDLITKLKCKLLIVSYNNTYDAKSQSSINKISQADLLEILSKKGKVKKYEIDYKYFNTGKTDFNNHKEILYVCEVKDEFSV